MGGRGIKYVSKHFAYFRLKLTLRVYTPGTLCKACNVNIATKRYHLKKTSNELCTNVYFVLWYVCHPTYICFYSFH